MTDGTAGREAIELAAEIEVTGEMLLEAFRASLKSRVLESEAERLGGAVYLGAEAEAIWDRVAEIALDQYLAALPAQEPVTEDELVKLLNRFEHAPRENHNPRDGSCMDCPWPLQALSAEEVARAILAEFDVTKKEQ